MNGWRNGLEKEDGEYVNEDVWEAGEDEFGAMISKNFFSWVSGKNASSHL